MYVYIYMYMGVSMNLNKICVINCHLYPHHGTHDSLLVSFPLSKSKKERSRHDYNLCHIRILHEPSVLFVKLE